MIQEQRIQEIQDFIPMYATHEEVSCFVKHIVRARQIVEFGCGGSTFLSLYVTDARVLSIESDKSFILALSKIPLLENSIKDKRLRFLHIDIGALKKWGIPLDESKKEQYPKYSMGWLEVLSAQERRDINVVFVDGRFRVACILAAILYTPYRCKIIVHDFFNRESYHVVLPFLECIDRAGTLGVFIKKRHISKARVKELYEAYQYNWE